MKKTAYIDNMPYEMKDGESVISFLRRHQGEKSVPTLCDAPQLEAFGSCRVCSVEAALKEDGPTKTVASCHTPLQEGMYIYPHTDKIRGLRKNIIELVLTDHPLDCLTCEVSGNCELQDVAAKVGITDVRYPAGKTHLDTPKDLSHPYMVSDLSKCINCYRCVRACDEIQGEMVLNMHGRGFDNRIIKGMDTSFADSACVSCGACSQACPTAAISDKFASKSVSSTNKTKTICTYCGVGCNLDVSTVNGEVASIQATPDAEVNFAHTCLKGRYAFKFYNHPERLDTPLIREGDSFRKASWEEAFTYIANKLNAIKVEHGPDAVAGISSSRCTNEENYLMQKFMRAVIGTNNIDCCARVCHSPTALGMQKAFGTGAATNSIKDIKLTNCMLVWGASPTAGHPVTGAKIKQAAMKDTVLIVVDPRKTELARYAHHHIPLKPGTNVAMLNMFAYFIIEADLVDWDFINARSEDHNEFIEQIKKLDIDAMAEITGVDKETVRNAALAYASAPNAMEFHGLGVTEHSQGSKTVMLLSNLAMLTGNIGRPGVGINPLRGQNNVQGAADMGCQPHQGAGYFEIEETASQEHYNKHYGVKVPKKNGLKIPEMFDAAVSGELKSMWIMGEDVVQTDPNTHHVTKAMKSLELLVVQELFMSETAKLAHVVLPGASFLEKEGTFTNGERRIQKVNQAVQPRPGTKADGQIIVDIMNKMGYKQKGYGAKVLLEEICQVVPFFAGVTWENLGAQGLQWPVAPDGTGTDILHTETFKRGKGKFHYFDWVQTTELTDNQDDYPYVLTTGRVLEHYNCGTMTRRTANSELVTEDILTINPVNAREKGISSNDSVRLYSPRGEAVLKASVSEDVKPGILFTTFHFPDIMVNNITGDVHDEESMCPEYKVVAVDFEKV
jgi:formate dehydrogenase major subunit